MASKTAAKPAAKTPAKKASKPAARKAPEATAPETTLVDDGVSITIGDAHAKVKVQGDFDLDGLIAVVKRLDRARAALS